MDEISRVHAAWSGDPTRPVIPERVQEFFDRWLDTDVGPDCDRWLETGNA